MSHVDFNTFDVSRTEPAFHFSGETIINGCPTFTLTQGNSIEYHQHNNTTQDHQSGIKLLSARIAHDAIHDSCERYPPGKCHPGTRQHILKIILDWILDPNPNSDILWLYGPAGAGKSAIMQTVAELLRETHQKLYAGSFFFAREIVGHSEGNTPRRHDSRALFSTLAYQIAMNSPEMRVLVNDVMNADPTLPTKSMYIQLRCLIIDPLANSSFPLHTPTVIIDGLDECRDPQAQCEILSLISKAIKNTFSPVPLRFLISSRPEGWICDSFDRKPLFDITKRLSLSDSHNADEDIRKYLRDEFVKISIEKANLMTTVQLPWPSERTIDYLVQKASGQFIYASTVLKFIRVDFCRPHQQLDIICRPGPLQGSAFSDLDRLYTKILESYPRPDTLMSVLGGALAGLGIKGIEIFLAIEPEEIMMVLRATASLLHHHLEEYNGSTPEDGLEDLYGYRESVIKFYHLSFREFLQDDTRSGRFSISLQTVNDNLWRRFFETLIDSLNGTDTYPEQYIIKYGEIWGNFGYRDSAAKVSPAIMIHSCDTLLEPLELRAGDECILARPKSLLRYMNYAEYVFETCRDLYRNDHSIWEKIAGCLLDKIRTVQAKVITQLLLVDTSSVMEGLPYFMARSHRESSLSFLVLCNLSGWPADYTRIFLRENCHFFVEDRDYPGFYAPLYHLYKLFCNPSDGVPGGIFHDRYRQQCISVCVSLVPKLDRYIFYGTQEILPYKIQMFFDNTAISDIKDEEDVQYMREVVNVLYEHDWIQIGASGHQLLTSILNWLRRQWDCRIYISGRDLTKMRTIMARIYKLQRQSLAC